MIKLGYLSDNKNFDSTGVNFKILTHVSYAFAFISDVSGVVTHKFTNVNKIKSLRQNHPHLKISLAVVGWTSPNFSQMAQFENTRLNFAQSLKKIVDQYNFDGIDIDWEYPSCSDAGISSHPYDQQNFTLLMSLLRNILPKNKYLITFACGAIEKMCDSYEFAKLYEITDFMNLMSYDMGGSYYTTGLHTALYYCHQTKQKGGAYFVELFHSLGYYKNKIVLGCAFYGRGATKVESSGLAAYIYGEHGLYFDYDEILALCEKTQSNIIHELECCGAYVNINDTFISFDTPQTIKQKYKFVQENQLAGIMFWEYQTDQSRSLIKAIDEQAP